MFFLKSEKRWQNNNTPYIMFELTLVFGQSTRSQLEAWRFCNPIRPQKSTASARPQLRGFGAPKLQLGLQNQESGNNQMSFPALPKKERIKKRSPTFGSATRMRASPFPQKPPRRALRSSKKRPDALGVEVFRHQLRHEWGALGVQLAGLDDLSHKNGPGRPRFGATHLGRCLKCLKMETRNLSNNPTLILGNNPFWGIWEV